MDELIELFEILSKRFSEDELKTFCFKLKVSYDALSAIGQEAKARELVAYYERRGQIADLVRAIKSERPFIPLSPQLKSYLPSPEPTPVPVSVIPPRQEPERQPDNGRPVFEGEPGENQAKKFVKENMRILGIVLGVALIGFILFSLPGMIFNPENASDATETAAAASAEAAEIANMITPPTEPPPSTTSPTLTPTQTPRPTATPTIDPSTPPPSPTKGSRWTRPSDNMVMVYVPAGTFLMGSDPEIDLRAELNERPQHQVTLDDYWIDRTEVTNAQYRLCVQDGPCDSSLYMGDNRFNSDDQPVVGVYWDDAQAYCFWAGGQLPTEAQWEYAARGNDGRIYPWGNQSPTCELAQIFGCDGDTLSVDSFSPAGDSWVGAVDLAGNVWEWVADWYDSSYYDRSPDTNPAGPEAETNKVLRGGSWSYNATVVRSASRTSGSLTLSSTDIGFRCSASGS